MLFFTLIVALTAHSALAKPFGLCTYPCDVQQNIGATNGAYTQPGFGQPAYGQPSYGQPAYGQTGSRQGYARIFPSMSHSNLEDFGTEPVQTVYRPAAPVYQPGFSQPQQSEVVHVQQQIPMQPEIESMFTHSSSKASYESNNGYYKFHQPAVTSTIVREPIIQQQPIRMQPVKACIYDPCHY